MGNMRSSAPDIATTATSQPRPPHAALCTALPRDFSPTAERRSSRVGGPLKPRVIRASATTAAMTASWNKASHANRGLGTFPPGGNSEAWLAPMMRDPSIEVRYAHPVSEPPMPAQKRGAMYCPP